MRIDFDNMSYPDTVTIKDTDYKSKRDINKSILLIPCTTLPDLSIGDVVVQKNGNAEVDLKVIDMSFVPGGTLLIGTSHPNLITAKIENMTSDKHKKPESVSAINIGSLNAQQVQVGNNNSLNVTITLERLVKEIAQTGDPDAKSFMRKLLENSSVAGIIGAGASALLGLL